MMMSPLMPSLSPVSSLSLSPLFHDDLEDDDLPMVDSSDFNMYLNDIISDTEKFTLNCDEMYENELVNYINVEWFTSMGELPTDSETDANDLLTKVDDVIDIGSDSDDTSLSVTHNYGNNNYDSNSDIQGINSPSNLTCVTELLNECHDGSLFSIDFSMTCDVDDICDTFSSDSFLLSPSVVYDEQLSEPITEEASSMNEIDTIIRNELKKYNLPDVCHFEFARQGKPSEPEAADNVKCMSSNNILQEIQMSSTDENIKNNNNKNNNNDNNNNNCDNNLKDFRGSNSENNDFDESFELSMEIIQDNLAHDKQFLNNYHDKMSKKIKPMKCDENINKNDNNNRHKRQSTKNLNNIKFIIINNKVKLPTNNKYFNINNGNNKSFKLKFNNNNDMYVLKIVKPVKFIGPSLKKENEALDKQIHSTTGGCESQLQVADESASDDKDVKTEVANEKGKEEVETVNSDNVVPDVKSDNSDINKKNERDNIDAYNRCNEELKCFLLKKNRLKYFNCKLCKINFKTKDEYKKHLDDCKRDSKYVKCEICDKKFNFVQSLNRHTRTVHHGDKSYGCDICDKRFTRRNSLVAHLAIHSGEKNELCRMCGMSFTLKRNLRSHLLVVHNIENKSGDKKFKCDVCEKRFKQKKNLIEHKMVHSDMNNNGGGSVKKYECFICKKLYKKSTYVRHYKRRHSNSAIQSSGITKPSEIPN